MVISDLENMEMLADTQALDKVFDQAKRLSPENRLRLIQRIIQTLVPFSPHEEPRPLRFGEFGGDEASMSTWEDFSIAEWRPTDEELNGP
jgi:hypothetical protein